MKEHNCCRAPALRYLDLFGGSEFEVFLPCTGDTLHPRGEIRRGIDYFTLKLDFIDMWVEA